VTPRHGLAALALALAFSAGCSSAPKRGPTQMPFLGDGPVREEPTLRVAVLTNAESAVVTADGAFRLLGDGLDETTRFDGGVELTATRSGNGGVDLRSDLARFRRTVTGSVRLVPDEDKPVRVAGSGYHGGLEIRPGAANGVTVLNRVPMEEYLRGVVPHEISHGSPQLLEAVKAQAVAARTYAIVQRGQYEADGYDLLATVQDQVYGGVSGEAPTVDQALRETRGVVATHRGEPIVTNYSSTCGGHTADRDEVWDKPPLPYLRGVPDRGGKDGAWCARSKYFRWEETWKGDEFWRLARAALNRYYGHDIPESARLGQLEVAEKGPSGRVKTLLFRTSAGEFFAYGDRIRWILPRPGNVGPLRSILFELDVDHAKGQVSRVAAKGGGWGHGVGMCQWGAMERSRGGQDYEDILEHYYQGVRLAELYR
jgi:stage II sporulation protein D